MRGPTGESKLLAAQHEVGATWPQAALTSPPTAALTAYLCGSLEGWGELKQLPRAQPRGSRLGLKREHGAYRRRCLSSRSTARELAAARGVRRSNARGVRAVQVSQSSSYPLIFSF